jgi:hypothetical protein
MAARDMAELLILVKRTSVKQRERDIYGGVFAKVLNLLGLQPKSAHESEKKGT